jgi:signal transduction histidine kinase
MKTGQWQWLKRLPAVLVAPRPEPAEYAQRIVKLQRNIILPARLLVVSIVLYHFYASPWLVGPPDNYGVIFETIEKTFTGYALFVLGATALFYVVRRPPPGSVQWFCFAVGLADGVFLGGLTVLTGGFESILYWVYPALIILNALSIPLATPQIVLNLVLGIFFLGAGWIEAQSQPEPSIGGFPLSKPHITPDNLTDLSAVIAYLRSAPEPLRRVLWDGLADDTRQTATNHLVTGAADPALKATVARELDRILYPRRVISDSAIAPELPETAASPYILRVTVLVLLTFCCFGVQALAAAEHRAEEEQKEYAVRTEQLRSAGRLAAEVAHQIKNPLAIINTVTFSLQKNFAKEQPAAATQIEIIREEVGKADRIITQVMGYAQLSEGRVQKLNVIDEINRAIEEVFPVKVPTATRIRREFAASLPPLLMQQKHLGEAVSNLLQNARDAAGNQGHIKVTARCLHDDSVEIAVQDDGPGVPPDKLERVFEAYYTTKERGSGLGLAVVKHNAELYGGRVRAQSELGKGAKFTLVFPPKALMPSSS